MTAPRPHIDPALCNGCGSCVRECPYDVLYSSDKTTRARRDGFCVGCGHCVAICPSGAVSLPALGTAPELGPPATPEGLEALLTARRSVRSYRPVPVERALVERLAAAAGLAPSGCNARPVSITAVSDPDVLRAIDSAIDKLLVPLSRVAMLSPVQALLKRSPLAEMRALTDPNLVKGVDAYLHREPGTKPGPTLGAPLVLLFHADPARPTPGEDCLIVADHVCLTAVALGLGTCWNGVVTDGVNRLPQLRKRVHLPSNQRIYAALSMGWPTSKWKRGAPRQPVPVRYVG